MALSEEHAKWAREAGEAFAAAEENASSVLVTVGKSLRDFFINDEDYQVVVVKALLYQEKGLYKPLRAAFKKSYLATGKNEANVSANWSRILYQHAWPLLPWLLLLWLLLPWSPLLPCLLLPWLLLPWPLLPCPLLPRPPLLPRYTFTESLVV